MESESPSPITVSFVAERTVFAAPGLAGGKGGYRILVRPPGGGYGPAAGRDPALTARDRTLRYTSRSGAKKA